MIFVGKIGKASRYQNMVELPLYVDERLLTESMHDVLNCYSGKCDNKCCEYGCYLDMSNNNHMLLFENFKEDINYTIVDSPSEKYKQCYSVNNKNGMCSFFGDKNCNIMSFCYKNNLDWNDYRPTECNLFPLICRISRGRTVNLNISTRDLECINYIVKVGRDGSCLLSYKIINVMKIFDLEYDELLSSLHDLCRSLNIKDIRYQSTVKTILNISKYRLLQKRL